MLMTDPVSGKSFAIHTLGCKVNTYESDAMADSLKASGFVEYGFDEPADIYIVNTCTVTNIADRKSRQMLRRARKLNPDALIVAAGCYVDDAIKNDRLNELIEERVIDLAVSNKDKTAIVKLITEKISETAHTLEPDSKNNDEMAASAAGSFLTNLDGHSRAFIKVQDGCNMYCSYCIIPYVRGHLRSREPEDVEAELRLLAANGVTEAVITGIHLSSLENRLLDIIERAESVDGIKRIRLGSLEPTLITENFAARLASYDKLCPHFHLSLQSGDDTVLKRMNRHYDTARYEQSCEILKAYYEHPAITTDIIVGFPGETEEQFEHTLAYAERIGFYEAHVFKYSRRKGTPADRMEGQLTEADKAARSDRLMAVTDRLSEQFRSYYIGRKVEFLSEELVDIDGISYETGYTPEYVRCIRASSELHQNDIISGTAKLDTGHGMLLA